MYSLHFLQIGKHTLQKLDILLYKSSGMMVIREAGYMVDSHLFHKLLELTTKPGSLSDNGVMLSVLKIGLHVAYDILGNHPI